MKAMNALEMLKEDHDYVKKSYRAFQKLHPEQDLEMFPKLRRARLNLAALGKKLLQRKARLAARSG